MRSIVVIAALLAGVAVAMGAWAAHGAQHVLDTAAITELHTAVRYQFWHALALLAIVALSARLHTRWAVAAAWCFLAGAVAFSGSIYLLVLCSWHWLWPVTPTGGVLMILGWLLFAVAAWRGKHD